MTAIQRFRVGVIGDPVAHSISPAMHQPALDALAIPATYELWQTSLGELPMRIESLRAPDALGANVTVPHKQAVIPALDGISSAARRAGAVNTIINRGGRLFGDNTDIYGFATSLLAVCSDAKERNALILGAGGAARGIVLALEQLGVANISIANRHPERAQRLADDLAPTKLSIIAPDQLGDALIASSILINATSLGWHPGEWPIEAELLELLPKHTVVLDLTYRETELLAAARRRGLQAVDGLNMLVHQGARSLELWTGKAAPVAIMFAAAERARAARA